MGYYTKFRGALKFKPELTDEQAKELNEKIDNISPDELDVIYTDDWKLVNNNGEYVIIWYGGDSKYDDYRKLIVHIVKMIDEMGLNVSGDIIWRGEEFMDNGIIHVVNNKVELWGAKYTKDYVHSYSNVPFENISWTYNDY